MAFFFFAIIKGEKNPPQQKKRFYVIKRPVPLSAVFPSTSFRGFPSPPGQSRRRGDPPGALPGWGSRGVQPGRWVPSPGARLPALGSPPCRGQRQPRCSVMEGMCPLQLSSVGKGRLGSSLGTDCAEL